MALNFEGNWGEHNQQEILKLLGISSPEDTRIKEIDIRGKAFFECFSPQPKKYWSIAFIEAAFKELGLEFNREIEIPDSLRELRKKCFEGVEEHPGFLSVFDKGKIIYVILKK